MATRGWGGSIALAVGVAAGASAAQLGLGYGLGVIAWTAATDRAGESTWLASLAWTTWIAATATVLGAVATTGWLWALAVASVIDRAAAGQGLSTAQLAVWRFGSADFLRDTISLPGAALMMGIALAIGALSAWPSGRRGDNRVGVAIS